MSSSVITPEGSHSRGDLPTPAPHYEPIVLRDVYMRCESAVMA